MSCSSDPTIQLRLATGADAHAVAGLVCDLFDELSAPRASGYDCEAVARQVRALLDAADRAWAFLAERGDAAVAVLTLSECVSLYAGGRFGEICELYVRPALRSTGLGQRLIDAAVAFARDRAWTRLEVGAPEMPRWQRSVDFYERCGFVIVGPRLKRELR